MKSILITSLVSASLLAVNSVFASGNIESITLSFDFSASEQPILGSAIGDAAAAADLSSSAPLIVSRFVILPEGMRAEILSSDIDAQPVTANEGQALNATAFWQRGTAEATALNSTPSEPVALSEPLQMRGVRLQRVSANPIYHDAATGKANFLRSAAVRVGFRPDLTAHASQFERRYSADFLEVVRSLAANPEQLKRDDADNPQTKPGHYLVVTHENALQYVRPFIEWRRRSGWQVDILSLSDGDARNPQTVKQQIQARYDAYLNDGVEPFDQILLVGDRNSYSWPPFAGWILEAERGETIWPSEHADYKYACLEGDDNFPDVGFSRWCAGSPDILELFSNRTLAYEATPYMEDPAWFRRGAVFSQHWGNTPATAWDITIHSNVRWAREILFEKDFNDVRFYENYDYDQYGQRICPFLRNQFNDGSNLLLGRAENLDWSVNFQDVENSHVFPLYISLSGHGEYTSWSMLRNGTSADLKGAVASTCSWGAPATLPNSAVWLEMVNGLVQRDLSLGWARVLGVTIAENYFPDFQVQGQSAYLHIKSDTDVYGDPGLKPWMGEPRQVEAEIPDTVSTNPGVIGIVVHRSGSRDPISGAVVTLYSPGEMPENAAEYAGYDGMRSWTELTDADGIVTFCLDGVQLVSGAPLLVTVTGRDIKPWFGEAVLSETASQIGVGGVEVIEVTGNGDGRINPTETINVILSAHNWSNETVQNVAGRAAFTPYFTDLRGAELQFGNIEDGATVASRDTLQLRVHNHAPDASVRPELYAKPNVLFTNGEVNWIASTILDVVAPDFVAASANPIVIPVDGQPHSVDIALINTGRMASGEISARLECLQSGMMLVDSSALYSAFEPGAELGGVEGQLFQIQVSPYVTPGELIQAQLHLSGAGLTFEPVYITLQAGEPRENAPQGPDDYGYIAIDDQDAQWDAAPEYSWIEIDPRANNADFEGTQLNFTGRSAFDVGETLVAELGFTSRFYGREFSIATISTNGYIAPGDQRGVVNFQNWPLDRGIGGGAGMIAPFWMRLSLGDNGRVYTYADREQGIFIVEWSGLRQYPDGQEDLTFEVILRKREQWCLASGNPAVTFQYKTIANTAGEADASSRIPYASVGISSMDGKTGLNYSFRNTYPITSSSLENRRAIEFRTSLRPHTGVIRGRVTAAGSGEGLGDSKVGALYGRAVNADGGGYYLIDRVIVDEPFTMIAEKVGFGSAMVRNVSARENDTVVVNIEIRQGESALEEETPSPAGFALDCVYPNPFNSELTVNVKAVKGERLLVAIFDLQGREVARLFDAQAPRNSLQLQWNAGSVGAGVYFVRMDAEGATMTRKAVLLK